LPWAVQAGVVAAAVAHVVVFVQENHTTDNYFRAMRAWGANIAPAWPVSPNPADRAAGSVSPRRTLVREK